MEENKYIELNAVIETIMTHDGVPMTIGEAAKLYYKIINCCGHFALMVADTPKTRDEIKEIIKQVSSEYMGRLALMHEEGEEE